MLLCLIQPKPKICISLVSQVFGQTQVVQWFQKKIFTWSQFHLGILRMRTISAQRWQAEHQPLHYSTLELLSNILTPTPVCNLVFFQCTSALSSGFTFSLLKHHNSALPKICPYCLMCHGPYFTKPFISFSCYNFCSWIYPVLLLILPGEPILKII